MLMPVLILKKAKQRWLLTSFLVILLIALIIESIAGFVLFSLLQPTRQELTVIPEQFLLPYQNVQFQSKPDGIPLKGWWIPGSSSHKKAVIFAHGYGDNRSTIQAALPLAKQLHEKGFATLLFDFRNSGESGGNFTTVGIQEKEDLASAIDFVKSKGYQQVGVIGFSMGASTAIETVATRNDISALVVDSPFSDLKSYLTENLPVWSGLPAFFTPIILKTAELIGLDFSQVQPIQTITKIKNTPMFFIHTQKDPKIPYTESKKLLQAYQKQKQANHWWTPGTQHVDSYKAMPKVYLQRVSSFFEQNMP